MADAGVEDIAGELDALRLQLRLGGGDVVDVQGRVGVLLEGANSMPIFAGSQIPKQVSPTQNS